MAIAAVTFASFVHAAQPVPAVLNGAVSAGVKVVKQFPAPSGLTGWVLAQGGKHSIVYTTADKKTLIAGVLIDERGQNLSSVHEAAQVPQTDLSAAFAKLEKSAFVAEGTARNPKSVIYAFVDANCPFCHYLWQAVQPYEAAGLQVRWIPVATLGPTSMPKAISVLAAKDKVAAFRQMEENHGKPWTAPAGVSESSHPAIATSIQANGEAMAAFGIGGTPGIVWRDKQGKIRVKSGMPRLSEIPSMTGLPAQRNTNPALEKFM
ncbi:thiol:disulfide interchange protein DsbG [Massilia sp. Dwa41.01b]|uniref:thiol:disulfide interchange protein DsbG n=1 Tax=unclassified Massilia TaxID=2609279 RepID=UPI001603097B|nr:MULTISPECIES: thiol:disulfide interchange protein DsbG [unclassified Massilia]QNA88710.1 thiol:disulfide interchange protein DsbG [Massilia sp. Dwa41.01b]QNA99609.1 thiol:disulfide interchange protein DsbG [Massilia sp. Se16.2.3]